MPQSEADLMRDHHSTHAEDRMHSDQGTLIGSHDTNFGFDDEQLALVSTTHSDSMADFDALPLSWGYLDQLGKNAFPFPRD